MECGERRKSRDQDLEALGGEGEPFFRSSRRRLWGRGRDLRSGGKRDAGIGLKDVFGSWNISRISFIVNAAWAGPLRPTILIFLILLFDSLARAYFVMSVFLRTLISVNKVRATSSATFPCPTITASSPAVRSGLKSRYSGRPLYQPTKARAEYRCFAPPSPGIPS